MSDFFNSIPVMQPPTITELGEVIRRAVADGQAVYPVGGRTMLGFGLPPTRPGIAVDLRRLDQVIDYPARDMTITVQAGITVAQLRSILHAEKQRLPIDVPFAEQATLGGAAACNVSGPRRYGYGTLRDYVIGISFANDRGEEVKAGGRVVKNVAGYDLCKLHIGALGTLGIISQLTLKVRPAPQRSVLIAVATTPGGFAALFDQLHGSRTQPVCIAAVSPHLQDDARPMLPQRHSDSWLVLLGFEDDADVVDWQVQRLREELQRDFFGAWADSAAEPIWRWLTDSQLATDAAATFKANMPPSAVAPFLQFAEPLIARVHAEAGNGIVWGHLPKAATLDAAADAIRRVRERAVESGGNLVLTRGPDEWKETLGVWGQPCGDWELMRSVKRQMDPDRRFNPGRFLDGGGSINAPSAGLQSL